MSRPAQHAHDTACARIAAVGAVPVGEGLHFQAGDGARGQGGGAAAGDCGGCEGRGRVGVVVCGDVAGAVGDAVGRVVGAGCGGAQCVGSWGV